MQIGILTGAMIMELFVWGKEFLVFDYETEEGKNIERWERKNF
jgi:hypothetical protein